MINAEEFLGMTTSGANSTRVIPIPEDEYVAIVDTDGIGLADFTYKRGEREGQKGYRMTVRWAIDDPEGSIEKQIGRKPVITQSVMIDFTDEGGLDMGEGKNVRLGQLRDAVNQNEDGKPWQPAMLIGQQARIKVEHSIGDNGDILANVNRVTRF